MEKLLYDPYLHKWVINNIIKRNFNDVIDAQNKH